MKNSKKQGPTQWFIFFKDQLLLKKEKTEKGEIKYSVPYGTEPPLAPGSGSTIHEVFLPTDEMVHAFAIEQLVTETEEWVMVNLRGPTNTSLWTNIKLPESISDTVLGSA